MSETEIITLFDGYSTMSDTHEMLANCSCVLIKGEHIIIVDTMTSWDSEKILTALSSLQVKPDDINYVISTHGHSDHIGNNNLFLKAKHIVGFSFSFQDTYFLYPFDEDIDLMFLAMDGTAIGVKRDAYNQASSSCSVHKTLILSISLCVGKEYVINSSVRVIPTPGHTHSDVTVVVSSKEQGIVAITGDLFEKFEDIENPDIWKDAGSEDPNQQIQNRTKIADMADWIIPGHGSKFRVTEEIRDTLKKQASSLLINKES